MSICRHRPETPGSFTPCWTCICGKEVEAEVAAEMAADEEAS